jgi:hypothetical protein
MVRLNYSYDISCIKYIKISFLLFLLIVPIRRKYFNRYNKFSTDGLHFIYQLYNRTNTNLKNYIKRLF